MVYDLARLGTAEVINTERTAAYVRNGLVPSAATVLVPYCEGIAEALSLGGPYTTPMQDAAPWYDANDPDTWDFAGLIPVEVTGLDATTRTVTVTPTIGGVGLPGRPQRGPQTIGVTAVLVGRTSEGVLAGLAWLRRTLAETCADNDGCAATATLETLIACPGPISRVANTDAAPIVTVVTPPGPWSAGGGQTFEATPDLLGGGFIVVPDNSAQFGGPAVVPTPVEEVGGGAPDSPDYVSGGDAFSQYVVQATTWDPTLVFDCIPGGPLLIEWTVTSAYGEATTATPELYDTAGGPIEVGPTGEVAATGRTTLSWELPFGVSEDWIPALRVDGPVRVLQLTITSYPPLEAVECVNPYRRFLPLTVTASGPTVTDTTTTPDGVDLLTVEWVWTIGSPYRYGVPRILVNHLGYGLTPALVAPGVQYGDHGTTTIDATPYNCAAPVVLGGCAIDPGSPSLGTLPAAPAITGTGRPRITTQTIRDVWAYIPPSLVPNGEAVLSVQLAAADENPVVGVRVRVYDNGDATGTVLDKCDFAFEYLIDFIPGDGTMTIDGTTGQVTTVCGGVTQDASSMVRGDYGGPMRDPVLSCDRAYVVRIQWLDTYPRTVPGVYTSGDPNGGIVARLSLTTREG